MLWLIILIAVGFATALFAFTGARVKGARQVGNTHLMTVARVLVIVVLAVVALYAFGMFN